MKYALQLYSYSYSRVLISLLFKAFHNAGGNKAPGSVPFRIIFVYLKSWFGPSSRVSSRICAAEQDPLPTMRLSKTSSFHPLTTESWCFPKMEYDVAKSGL